MKEVFGNSLNYINSIETGLSADPLMVRRISELNRVSVISNSDSHSTNSMGSAFNSFISFGLLLDQ